MQVQEYIFRSPYPSRVQVGQPEVTTQHSSSNITKLNSQKVNSEVTNAAVKSKIGDMKLTADTNRLDIYA